MNHDLNQLAAVEWELDFVSSADQNDEELHHNLNGCQTLKFDFCEI